jgi:glycosyltransferase involved in cell wall biosynthesis
MTPRIAVILPAYNEEITIRDVILAFHTALPEAAIYVVDNNSRDRTAEIAQRTLAETGAKGAVLSERRQGKGHALRRAFHAVDADAYLLSDADLTYPAERARDLLRPILDCSADMVVGDRHSGGDYSEQNKRRLHGFGNNLVRGLINLFFRSELKDIMSGYRAFSRSFVKNYAILVAGFQIETDMTLHALDKRFRIVEMPVEYVDRPAGSVSKLNTLSDGLRVLSTIVQILRYYRPLAFFGTFALAAMLLGVAAGIPVLRDWIEFRYIHHVPLAILATALEVVAMVLLSIALVLDSLARQQRQNYELHLLATPEAGHG